MSLLDDNPKDADKRADPEDADLATVPSTSEAYFTVSEAIDKMGFGPFQILITVCCGLLWVADAMEFMILSILSPIIKCQWDLSSFSEACVTIVVFIGILFGALFWGFMCDWIGRKKSLLIVNVTILIFGVLSALPVSAHDSYLPGYPWLLICRFAVGFTAAGTSQVITYYAEFLPQKKRGFWLVTINVWWTIGTMFCAALALIILGVLQWSWHWFLGFAALPLALVLVLFPLVPESARYHLVKGNNDKAMKVLRRIAKMNRKDLPCGHLILQEDKDQQLMAKEVVKFVNEQVVLPDSELAVVEDNHLADKISPINVDVDSAETVDHFSGDTESLDLLHDEKVSRGRLGCEKVQSVVRSIIIQMSPLFTKGMWRTTVLLWFIWFGGAWLYYGAVILTTNLLRYDPHCSRSLLNETNSTECYELDTGDYVKILWSSAAEIPGLIITFIIIDIIGRKKTMCIEFVLSAGGFLLLLICASDVVLAVFLFFIRAFAFAVFQVAYVYTPEVYPTKSRALGLGLCSTMARVGGIATPIVADVVYEANDYVCICLYAGSCLVFAVMAILLPIETKGRTLKDKGS